MKASFSDPAVEFTPSQSGCWTGLWKSKWWWSDSQVAERINIPGGVTKRASSCWWGQVMLAGGNQAGCSQGKAAALEQQCSALHHVQVPWDRGPVWLQLAIHLSALGAIWGQNNMKAKPKWFSFLFFFSFSPAAGGWQRDYKQKILEPPPLQS